MGEMGTGFLSSNFCAKKLKVLEEKMLMWAVLGLPVVN